MPSRCTFRGFATVGSNRSSSANDSGSRGSHPPAAHRPAGVCPFSGCTPPVVDVHEEPADGGVQLRHCQRRGDQFPLLPGGMYPGRVGSSSVVRVPKKRFDLAPVGLTGRAVDQPHSQVSADLSNVCAGEIRAVVAVQHGRKPAHRPLRVGLAPYRLPLRQRSLRRRRRTQEHRVTSQHAGVVIQHPRSTTPGRLAAFVQHPYVKLSGSACQMSFAAADSPRSTSSKPSR